MKDYLGFTVIGALVATLGTLVALFIKDFLLVRYFDSFRERRSLEKISKKYKDPILLSASELLRRINQYSQHYDDLCVHSERSILFTDPQKMESNYDTDPYFLNYKQISTLYRFCSFFAWLELYRQEITFLDSHSSGTSQKTLEMIGEIRKSVADGQINTNEDWESWTDPLIFREELRGIGEGMIESVNNQRTILGYWKFKKLVQQFGKSNEPSWLNPPINFFTDLKTEKDFRSERFKLLGSALRELIKCLDANYYDQNFKSTDAVWLKHEQVGH